MFESGLCRQERHPQNKGNARAEAWDRPGAGRRWQRTWGPKDVSVAFSDRRAGARREPCAEETACAQSLGDAGCPDSHGSRRPSRRTPSRSRAPAAPTPGAVLRPRVSCSLAKAAVVRGAAGGSGPGCLCPKPIGPRASGPPPLPPAPRELSRSLRHPARGHPALGHLVNSAETRVWPFVPALLGARGAHVSAARPWPPAEGRARPFLPLGHVCRVGMARQRPLRGSDLLSLDPQSLRTG